MSLQQKSDFYNLNDFEHKPYRLTEDILEKKEQIPSETLKNDNEVDDYSEDKTDCSELPWDSSVYCLY